MKKTVDAFSLLEIVVILLIIAILALLALSKMDSSLNKTAMVKFQIDVMNLKTTIAQAASQKSSEGIYGIYPSVLDTCIPKASKCNIFKGTNEYKLMQESMLSCDTAKAKKMCWEKIDTTKYRAWINENDSIDFTYTSSSGTFLCDESHLLCQEISK